ncbi:MAG: fructose-6-phosphate aldolase [Fimbriimonadales bacterium]|nr:fructose-6-phosphate aldolase [Armatimonadota bacterium]MCX7688294.1 fructose-6-phosphate aldolase [Fimbriimonadales bacterium]GBC90940.1 Transaldolase [bacterium HR14]GIV13088.1 MAG: transaldolase [Fimbriimonadales bacterium]CUU38174.1 transaldolase [Armatimonadetes bacterium DC]
MKLFVDTGQVEEVRQAAEWGIIDGVTTNPSLIAKAGRGFKETVLAMCEILPHGSISAEVVGTTVPDILKEAREIASWAPNIVVKVPMTPAGIQATRQLRQEGIRVNMTLVFSPAQALLAAKAGATYISVFVGRVDDIASEGMRTIEEVVQMVDAYGFESEVLVASIRHPMHVVEAMRMGAHIATMPFKVLEQLFHHPLTDIGLQRFLEDWNKAGLRIFDNPA